MTDYPTLVIVDDEEEILSSIKRALMRIDINIESFTSPRLALSYIEKHKPALVISDQRMPDMNGMELLTKINSASPETKRVMLSGFQDFDVVADGFNRGVIQQFLSKPWVNAELQLLVRSNVASADSGQEKHVEHEGMVGEDTSMLILKQQINKAAGANVPIFIHGETGTGKELVAKACHQLGCKNKGKFIAVNCANFSESLIESQLFGHKKGAFTGATSDQLGVFAQGNGGTIFLDEITTLPLNLQSKLLRVLQERVYSPVGSLEELSFDAQIVSASSMSLHQAVASGEFREDLFYRLNVIALTIPALKERSNDVMLLAQHFLKIFNEEQNKSFVGFDDNAAKKMLEYDWPGNVRQLENVIHGASIMNTGNFITGEMLTPFLHNPLGNTKNQELPDNNDDSQFAGLSLEEVEKQAIQKAIDECGGNISKAASLLDVNPSTIYRKLKSWT